MNALLVTAAGALLSYIAPLAPTAAARCRPAVMTFLDDAPRAPTAAARVSRPAVMNFLSDYAKEQDDISDDEDSPFRKRYPKEEEAPAGPVGPVFKSLEEEREYLEKQLEEGYDAAALSRIAEIDEELKGE